MNYSKIKRYDATNWSGINATIFFSGCDFHCPGCFNSDIWDFNLGIHFDKAAMDKFIEYAKSPHVTGVCILGGEPFQQDLQTLMIFLSRIKKEVKKPIRVWSGYTFEELISDPNKKQVLYLIDTLIDGQFKKELKDLRLKHRGSSNQRVIDIIPSLKWNKAILLDI